MRYVLMSLGILHAAGIAFGQISANAQTPAPLDSTDFRLAGFPEFEDSADVRAALGPPDSAYIPSPRIVWWYGNREFTVGGAWIGKDSVALRDSLGPPDEVEIGPIETITWYYRDFSIPLAYGVWPSGVTLTGASHATKRGLRVGDSKERVLALYGRPSFALGEQWDYPEIPHDPVRGRVIRIRFKSGRVESIYIGGIVD